MPWSSLNTWWWYSISRNTYPGRGSSTSQILYFPDAMSSAVKHLIFVRVPAGTSESTTSSSTTSETLSEESLICSFGKTSSSCASLSWTRSPTTALSTPASQTINESIRNIVNHNDAGHLIWPHLKLLLPICILIMISRFSRPNLYITITISCMNECEKVKRTIGFCTETRCVIPKKALVAVHIPDQEKGNSRQPEKYNVYGCQTRTSINRRNDIMYALQ